MIYNGAIGAMLQSSRYIVGSRALFLGSDLGVYILSRALYDTQKRLSRFAPFFYLYRATIRHYSSSGASARAHSLYTAYEIPTR